MATTERRYPDSIETSDGKMVRVTTLNPNHILTIGKNRTKIKVSDIPITVGLTTCGKIIRGIAFTQGNVIFCEDHQKDEFIEEIVS